MEFLGKPAFSLPSFSFVITLNVIVIQILDLLSFCLRVISCTDAIELNPDNYAMPVCLFACMNGIKHDLSLDAFVFYIVYSITEHTLFFFSAPYAWR